MEQTPSQAMHRLPLGVMSLLYRRFIGCAVCHYGHSARTGLALRLSAVHYISKVNGQSSCNSRRLASYWTKTSCQAASSAAMSVVPPEPNISRAYPDEPRVSSELQAVWALFWDSDSAFRC